MPQVKFHCGKALFCALAYSRPLCRCMKIPVLFSLWLVAFWKFIISTKLHYFDSGMREWEQKKTRRRALKRMQCQRLACMHGIRVNGPLLLSKLACLLCRLSLCAVFFFCWNIIHYGDTLIVIHFYRAVFLQFYVCIANSVFLCGLFLCTHNIIEKP